MPEYAFDVVLYAVCRVTAKSEKEARRKMDDVIDCINLDYEEDDVLLTEASQAQDKTPLLFEVDGKDPPFPSEAHYIAAASDDGWLPGDEDTAQEYCESMGIDASTANPREAREV